MLLIFFFVIVENKLRCYLPSDDLYYVELYKMYRLLNTSAEFVILFFLSVSNVQLNNKKKIVKKLKENRHFM